MARIIGLNVGVFAALFFLVTIQHLGTSTASPVISASVPESAKLLKLAEAKDLQQSNEILGPTTTTLGPQQQQSPVATVQKLPPMVKISSVDKLKRGLTSFISQQNPGSFFVPPAPVLQQQLGKGVGGGTQSSSSSNLVNGDGSAEAIIKGPNRLIQTRPIGGATRWGRR